MPLGTAVGLGPAPLILGEDLILWAWTGVFKPNLQNIKTCILLKVKNYCIDSNQILHSDKDRQMPFMGAPNTRI